MRILVTEPLSDRGLDLLREEHQVDVRTDLASGGLAEAIPSFDALVVRSQTKVDASVIEAGSNLKVIARAGIGLDNVDVEAATRRGVMVVNAPQSNILSAAEHTLALILASARNVPRADAALRSGRWERERFQGVELHGKTLGIVGLGRVGTMVAQRALAFGMRLIAFDPYVSRERARELSIELMPDLGALLVQADIVTIHLPRTAETEGLIGERELGLMKEEARIVNTARGGIVDEEALTEALRDGRLALRGEFVPYAVNVAAAEVTEQVRPFLPLAERLGRILTGLAEAPTRRLGVEYVGRIAEADTRVLTLAAVKGALTGVVHEPVSYVNAPTIARERGLEVSERRSPESQDYVNLVVVRGATEAGEVEGGGTPGGAGEGERLVRVYDFDIDMAPSAHMVFFRYEDRPGVIGSVGTILGEAGINIASMEVGRKEAGGLALMCLTVDSPIPAEVLDRIVSAVGMKSARQL